MASRHSAIMGPSVEDTGEGQPLTDVGHRVVWFKSH
jgi:hypothetical protein